jgi:DNA-directed RNA polymerase specialized sigma24 family protein
MPHGHPPSPHTTQFHDWVARLQAGDAAAGDQLLRGVARRLEFLARRLLRGFGPLRRWEQTDNVLQEVRLRILRALARNRPDSMRDFYALSACIIRHQLIDLWRRYFGPAGPGTAHRGAAPEDDSPDLGLLHEEAGRLPVVPPRLSRSARHREARDRGAEGHQALAGGPRQHRGGPGDRTSLPDRDLPASNRCRSSKKAYPVVFGLPTTGRFDW